jgi:hypothetical protein
MNTARKIRGNSVEIPLTSLHTAFLRIRESQPCRDGDQADQIGASEQERHSGVGRLFCVIPDNRQNGGSSKLKIHVHLRLSLSSQNVVLNSLFRASPEGRTGVSSYSLFPRFLTK